MAGPRWVRLDVDYFANPKALAAGRNGRDLHLASICWVARYLTDGSIPDAAVEAIARDAGLTSRQTALGVDSLLAAGLWLPNGVGYHLHDYLEMNGSKADTERERAQWRARQRRARSSQSHGETDA